jgi:CheY-like chemotaxis protein
MDSSGSVERAGRLGFGYGSGTTDRIDRVPTAASGSRALRSERDSAAESKQVVLLIEDNPAVIATVADCLQGAGYQLLCAADVEDAVRKVASRAIALVLLNWRLLSRIGGSELIGQLRTSSMRGRLPMVVISDEVSALNEASSLGIEDYLLDPFHLDDLLHVVDEHCC